MWPGVFFTVVFVGKTLVLIDLKKSVINQFSF